MTLNLSGNSFDDKAAEYLNAALIENKRAAGMNYIAEALKVSNSSTTLYLTCNYIKSIGTKILSRVIIY